MTNVVEEPLSIGKVSGGDTIGLYFMLILWFLKTEGLLTLGTIFVLQDNINFLWLLLGRIQIV
ncbi:hypothetical protein D3C85_1716230 [compost metagenome]